MYHQLPGLIFSKECGPLGLKYTDFEKLSSRQPVHILHLLRHPSFLFDSAKKWISSMGTVSRNYRFHTTEQEVWHLKYFPSDRRGMEHSDRRRRLEDLSWHCKASLKDAVPGIWEDRSQSSNSLSCQQWTGKRHRLSDVSEVTFCKFCPSCPKMNEIFSKHTSSELNWNLQPTFVPSSTKSWSC